ncbi:MAG TPA: UDP-N-acetylglucosamine 2-epimerase (non-hydrolyzing) [Acidimicrobiales bacterium]
MTGSRSVAVVLGTRPEVVKMSGIIRLLGDRARVFHTGQHYDANLSDVFFTEAGLRAPDVQFDLQPSAPGRAGQVAAMLNGLAEQFDRDRPAAVLVHGDTNSTLAGALAANGASIPLVHVEAGLRSFDRAMPEEHNRVATDHLADLLCAPTAVNVAQLARERVAGLVVETGNTVVEATIAQLPTPAERGPRLAARGLVARRYVLATLHRPENTDDPDRLGATLDALSRLPCPVIFPVHPRTRQAADRAGLAHLLERLATVEPLGPSDFLALAADAALLVSDSGGVQEEATVLKRPLLVVRTSTERPEALAEFAALVEPHELLAAASRRLADIDGTLDHLARVRSPYGDGQASRLVVEAVDDLIAGHERPTSPGRCTAARGAAPAPFLVR